jgi:hypothetical protein
VTNDVLGGRHQLNFSEWDRPQDDADEAAEAVREGWMPLGIYLPLHPEARLSEAEKAQLAAGLDRSLVTRGESQEGSGPEGAPEHAHDEH